MQQNSYRIASQAMLYIVKYTFHMLVDYSNSYTHSSISLHITLEKCYKIKTIIFPLNDRRDSDVML